APSWATVTCAAASAGPPRINSVPEATSKATAACAAGPARGETAGGGGVSQSSRGPRGGRGARGGPGGPGPLAADTALSRGGRDRVGANMALSGVGGSGQGGGPGDEGTRKKK